MTHLRKLMLEDLTRHFHVAPDQRGRDEIRAYQVHLLQERKQARAQSAITRQRCASFSARR